MILWGPSLFAMPSNPGSHSKLCPCKAKLLSAIVLGSYLPDPSPPFPENAF